MLELKNIEKGYVDGKDTHVVLSNVSMKIHDGDFTSIMGRSGSGKTTLLYIIAGLVLPDSGDYFWNNQKLDICNANEMRRFRNEHIGFIMQDDVMLYDRNVEENIKLSALFSKRKDATIDEEVAQLAERLGISELLQRNPSKLSGGERQRVSIARALLGGKKVLLADEPTGALDEETEADVLNVLKELNDDGITIIIVTHDNTVAAACKKHVYLRSGMISQDEA